MSRRKPDAMFQGRTARLGDLTVADHTISADELTAFCRRHAIRRLALFGSVLRSDFRPDSDIDLLVEFEPGQTPDLFNLFELEEELSVLPGGHPLDLVTVAALNPYLRPSILASAKVIYGQG